MKRRLIYFVLSLACFMGCVIIVKLFSNYHFIRGFVGDIVVILLIYFFAQIFHEFHPAKLTIFTLLSAYIVEFLQYFKLISILGLEQNIFARLIIGSVFDPLDLAAYTIGAVIVYTVDMKLVRTLKCFK